MVTLTSPNEKLLQQASSAKLIHLAEQIIFPWFEERIREIQYQMASNFKEGKDCTHQVALIASLIMLRDDLVLITKKGDSAAARLHGPTM